MHVLIISHIFNDAVVSTCLYGYRLIHTPVHYEIIVVVFAPRKLCQELQPWAERVRKHKPCFLNQSTWRGYTLQMWKEHSCFLHGFRMLFWTELVALNKQQSPTRPMEGNLDTKNDRRTTVIRWVRHLCKQGSEAHCNLRRTSFAGQAPYLSTCNYATDHSLSETKIRKNIQKESTSRFQYKTRAHDIDPATSAALKSPATACNNEELP